MRYLQGGQIKISSQNKIINDMLIHGTFATVTIGHSWYSKRLKTGKLGVDSRNAE